MSDWPLTIGRATHHALRLLHRAVVAVPFLPLAFRAVLARWIFHTATIVFDRTMTDRVRRILRAPPEE